MPLTNYHAECFAHELIKRCLSDSAEKFANDLVDAQNEIDRQRERLIAEIEGKLQQRTSLAELFRVRWKLV